jgi:hypothetical protein
MAGAQLGCNLTGQRRAGEWRRVLNEGNLNGHSCSNDTQTPNYRAGAEISYRPSTSRHHQVEEPGPAGLRLEKEKARAKDPGERLKICYVVGRPLSPCSILSTAD